MLKARKDFLEERKKGKSMEKEEEKTADSGKADVVLESADEKKKERDASIEKYFGAIKDYKPGGAEKVEKVHPEIDPNKRAKKPLIVEEAEKPKESAENEKLLKLEKQLDEARKAFIGKDIEAEKKSSKFWKLFRVGSLGEYSEEHKGAREEYYAALKAYKDEYLNVHGLNEKSVAEMITFFNIKEHYNLESARLDTSNRDAGWPKKIWNGYMGMINRYRKVGEKDKSKFKKYSKKIAAGMFVAVVATGAAASGGALAGAAGTIVGAALIRGFTIGVSSAGFKAMYEGLAQSSKRRESEREMAYISRSFKEPNVGEIYYNQVLKNLDEKINSIDKIMQEQKQWKRFRTFAAVGTAVVISQAGRYFGRWASEKASHWFAGTGAHEAVTDAPGGAGAPEVIPPIEKTVDLPAINEGGSIEGSIMKHLTNNPDLIDKYNEQLGGDRKFDAGQIAHRMFEEYGDKRDLVHAGAQVQLSPDGLRIQGVVGDENMGFLRESATEAAVAQPEVEAAPDNIENPEVNVSPDNVVDSEVFNRAHESVFGHNTDNFLESAERELYNAERSYGGNYGLAANPAPGPGPGSAWFENMTGNRNFFSAFRDQIVSGNPDAATRAFQNEIARGGDWEKIKNLPFGEATKNMNWRASEKMESLFKNLRNILGDSIKPGTWPAEETMEAWTKRVAETAVEQANKKY